ncbi:AcrR family transcriptional regulator [Saccharothrix coeruleofusca]|uniref:TetR/AcrR family transcriptional regulator n=1 Tax=Saccharothrix coeruleofusca TaxID=33919 RepID=UPI001AE1F620|nr:TetR/AcrR family transcriptional regulator [Saccharothrix coeruleofusca]MBP2338171.1 AcrR family transcriptional regulator [Saccharothrix coeruleofusca]
MPKIVDHDQRRAALARAVWAVIDQEGIEGATVRRVAEEAGVSVGGLRHYFDSQRGLLLFAAREVASAVGARVTAHLRGDLPGPERARRLLEELLPLDAERRVEVDVWLACLMRSRVDPALAELRRAGWEGERHVCRLAVAHRRAAAPPPAIGDELGDPLLERLAERLHVFIDGLTLQAAAYQERLPPRAVRALLAAELDAIARQR